MIRSQYPEYIELNSKKQNQKNYRKATTTKNPVKKWEEDLNRHFPNRGQMLRGT